jgi:hypothetical protein
MDAPVERSSSSVHSETESAENPTSHTKTQNASESSKEHHAEALDDALLVLKPLHAQKASRIKRLFLGVRIFFSWLVTFHFVSMLWIFFRAEDMQTALYMIQRVIRFNLPGDGFSALVLVAIILTMFLQVAGPYIFRFFVWFLQKLWAPMQILLIAIACSLILKLGPDGVLPFIYFQF